MKIELSLKKGSSQYLGTIEDKSIVITPNQKLILSGEEWEKISSSKWIKYLIEKEILEVKEIDKKMKKMEKDIERGNLEVDAE